MAEHGGFGTLDANHPATPWDASKEKVVGSGLSEKPEIPGDMGRVCGQARVLIER